MRTVAPRGGAETAMTTAAKLLGRKQQLIERLHEDDLGPHERDEIERLIKEIDTALNLLDRAGPGETVAE